MPRLLSNPDPNPNPNANLHPNHNQPEPMHPDPIPSPKLNLSPHTPQVPRLLGPSKQQLLDAFGKQLTTAATALQESPAMQLTAITAMRRRTAKPPKNPRGVRVGLGVVGACHSKIGGGQGNLQTFAGYTSGLNSAHVLFANDGAIPDSSGSEPDLLRFQPKLNFDIAI